MENNIYINFARRLKGKGWSINNVNKMNKMLAINANKGIL